MFATTLYMLLLIISLIFVFIFHIPYIKIRGKERGGRSAQWTAKKWGRFLMWAAGAKVDVVYNDEGTYSQLKDEEPIVIVGNHQSNMDIPAILGYFPREVGFVAKKEMESWPFFGVWMKYGQCVFLDRKNPREGMKNMKDAVKKIQEGFSIVIFPEGTRSEDGSIGEFKKGSFKLASDPMVKIVPVTLKGTFDIQRKGSLRINRGKKVKLIINKVIDPKTLPREEVKKLNETVRDAIREAYKNI